MHVVAIGKYRAMISYFVRPDFLDDVGGFVISAQRVTSLGVVLDSHTFLKVSESHLFISQSSESFLGYVSSQAYTRSRVINQILSC